MESYRGYPKLTLNTLANKKLPIDSKLKDIILLVNEKADGTGFPSGVEADRLTFESQLIRFCKNFDMLSTLKHGEKRLDHAATLKEIVNAQVLAFDEYAPTFTTSLKKAV
ncbi:MAG: HD domain-containing phosphohydrolase [Bdellovibrionales bacterium]